MDRPGKFLGQTILNVSKLFDIIESNNVKKQIAIAKFDVNKIFEKWC